MMFPLFPGASVLGDIFSLLMRAMAWIYIYAWPVGLGLIAYTLAGKAAHNQALGLLAGAFGFGAGVTIRFFRRFPEAWPVWKERWKMLLTRKKEA